MVSLLGRLLHFILADSIIDLSKLKLTPEERKELSKACPYFSESYLDYLSNMQLDPVKQVKLTFISQGSNEKGEEMGEIGCVIEGPWKDTILYEVPIMAICKLKR